MTPETVSEAVRYDQPHRAAETAVATAGTGIVCPVCGDPFEPTKANREHCSDKCKFAAWDRENPRLKKASTQQLQLALKARDKGIERVKGRNSEFIETMRKVAVMIAQSRLDRTVTADDLREWLKNHPEIGEPTSYNAYGAIFSRNPDFEFHGYYTSRQKQGHGNRLIRWLLVTPNAKLTSGAHTAHKPEK